MHSAHDVSASSEPRIRLWEQALWSRGLLTVLAILLTAAPVAAQRVEIVLDVSGSMRGSAGAATKMEAAQQAVKRTVDAVDPSSNVALRFYGHRLPSKPKEPSCQDTELVIPFGPIDKARFADAVDGAKPLGQTPLAYSLKQAAADFDDLGDEAGAVILVSDGEETCRGDPAAIACAFADRGLALTVHTVGFDVDATARQQLQAIAECTDGEYRDANDADELGTTLAQLTQAGLLLDKEREELGREIRGGDGFASAVPITPGTYRLDHHQRKNEYDYFSIELEPGYLLRVSQEAYEIGVEIRGDTFTEGSTSSYAGVAIHGPDRERISRDAAVGAGKQASAGTHVTSGQGGSYYILIGANRWTIHKSSPITVEVVDQTDAGSGTDAGSSDREAVSIDLGDHEAWLQAGDTRDVFAFEAHADGSYGLRVRPEKREARVEMTVTDEDGVELTSERAPNDGAGVRVEGLRPERSGRLFVAVESVFSTRPPTRYTLQLTEDGSTAEDAEGASDRRSAGDDEDAREDEDAGEIEQAATSKEDADEVEDAAAADEHAETDEVEDAGSGGSGFLRAIIIGLLVLAAIPVGATLLRRRSRR